ncbi:carbohydrate ABC transporter permease [Ruania alba]|uniref:Carbohydrate ABC transporter membrane protein 2, CUT1 family n=1 Tax=Ruania alba TaxID=648782 RepID=A0A1H5MBF7_9MICO|nr:carbohydrate ABC transporter permease [Ruania alba]SEE85768.1 carbohydrate ABC transporter membrane protein 2, CUT1 family [Ruania alba]
MTTDTAMTAPQRATKGPRPRILAHIGLIAIAVLMMYPLVWMISSSLKPESEIFSSPGLIPQEWTLSNYIEGWNGIQRPFSHYMLNSILIAVLAVLGNVIACSLAAYAFARLHFPLKRTLFAIMLGTMMLPIHVQIIPQYIIFDSLAWLDTFLPLVVPKFLAVDAFFIFLIVQFIRGIPKELDFAARVDGCGPVNIFFRIILPLLKPALVTTAIFTFIWSYNDFFAQVIFLSSNENFTAPLALKLFLDQSTVSSWGPMFAMSVVSLVPLFAFFLFFQRGLIEGIATTGFKG